MPHPYAFHISFGDTRFSYPAICRVNCDSVFNGYVRDTVLHAVKERESVLIVLDAAANATYNQFVYEDPQFSPHVVSLVQEINAALGELPPLANNFSHGVHILMLLNKVVDQVVYKEKLDGDQLVALCAAQMSKHTILGEWFKHSFDGLRDMSSLVKTVKRKWANIVKCTNPTNMLSLRQLWQKPQQGELASFRLKGLEHYVDKVLFGASVPHLQGVCTPVTHAVLHGKVIVFPVASTATSTAGTTACKAACKAGDIFSQPRIVEASSLSEYRQDGKITSNERMWFLKQSDEDYQNGICFGTDPRALVAQADPNCAYVLQPMVPELMTLDGHLFTLRMYMLLVCHSRQISAYLYADGKVVCNPAAAAKSPIGRRTRKAKNQHRGPRSRRSRQRKGHKRIHRRIRKTRRSKKRRAWTAEMILGHSVHGINKVHSFKSLPVYDDYLPAVVQAMSTINDTLIKHVFPPARGNNNYALFGVDVLLDTNKHAFVLETNLGPAVTREFHGDLYDVVQKPMVDDIVQSVWPQLFTDSKSFSFDNPRWIQVTGI